MTTATATAEVPTTRSGRPKVPPLDTAAINTEVDQLVDDALAKAGDDEKEQLLALVRIMATADETVARLKDEMYAMALSLHIYGQKVPQDDEDAPPTFTGGARGVWRGIGVSRETFSRRHVAEALDTKHWPDSPRAWTPAMAQRGLERGVEYIEDAAVRLPAVAAKVYRARAIQRRVLPLRDDLMLRFRDQGMTLAELAGIIGRNPSRASHIVGKKAG